MANKLRIQSIDMIKGIAMIFVILVHYEQSFGICRYFDWFQLGCDIFFVTSGFTTAILAASKYNMFETNNSLRGGVLQYYKSRLMSILPGWYFSFAMVYFVNTVALVIFGQTFSFGSNRDLLSIICNLCLLNGLFPFCNNNVMPGGWYIGCTIILYWIAPYIFIILKKIKKYSFLILAGSSVLLFCLLYVIFPNFKNDGFAYHFFLFRFPEFILGIKLYYDVFIHHNKSNNKIYKYVFFIGIGLFALSFIVFFNNLELSHYYAGYFVAIGTYCILRILMEREIYDDQPICKSRWALLKKFGKNSYYIYLTHCFVVKSFVKILSIGFEMVGIDIKTFQGFVILMPICIVLSYYLGVASKFIIERIINRKRIIVNREM